MTLRGRLLLLLVSLLAAALLVAGTLLTLGVREYAQVQAERSVQQALSGVSLSGAGLESADERLGVWYRRLSEAAVGLNTTGLLALPSGQAYRTDTRPAQVPAAAVAQARVTGQARSGDARLLATPGGTVLLLNVPRAEVLALTRRVAWTFTGVAALTLLLAALAGWALLGVGLRPLHLMARQAETLHPAEAGSEAASRLPLPTPPDEVRSLAESLNRMLARLDDTVRQLRQEEARTRAFAADASHELRTPLAAIQGSLEVLERAGDDPDARARLTASLRREARRAGRLVDDLLTLTRLDAGEALRTAPLDLQALLQEVTVTARDLAPHLHFALHAPPLTVPGDRERVEGAVWNLLRNAIAATPPGGWITLLMDAHGPQARVSVRNPAQLPPELRARMFERFSRGPDAPAGGVGLGLAIVRATARAHGGEAFVTQDAAELEVGFTLPGPAAPGRSADLQPERPGRSAPPPTLSP